MEKLTLVEVYEPGKCTAKEASGQNVVVLGLIVFTDGNGVLDDSMLRLQLAYKLIFH